MLTHDVLEAKSKKNGKDCINNSRTYPQITSLLLGYFLSDLNFPVYHQQMTKPSTHVTNLLVCIKYSNSSLQNLKKLVSITYVNNIEKGNIQVLTLGILTFRLRKRDGNRKAGITESDA